MRSIRAKYSLLLMLTLVSPSYAAKVYVDDCRHWLEVSTAIVALHTQAKESLTDVISYIEQYLYNSQIPTERRRQLLLRSREVWEQGLMFGHDLEHHLLDKCDVQ